MDLEQQEFLNEICWIVNQRNIWAKKRQHYRNKMYRSGLKLPSLKHLASSEGTSTSSNTANLPEELKVALDSLNVERVKLSKFTKRLRYLLKQINGHLVPDSNAGYHYIKFYKPSGLVEDSLFGNIIIKVQRDEIVKYSLIYETNLAISSMLK